MRRDQILALIQQDPLILGLGELSLEPPQSPLPPGRGLSLEWVDADQSVRWLVELQTKAADEKQILRGLNRLAQAQLANPQNHYRALLIAEVFLAHLKPLLDLLKGQNLLQTRVMRNLSLGAPLKLRFEGEGVPTRTDAEGATKTPATLTDRAYWQRRSKPGILALADLCLEILRIWQPQLAFVYSTEGIYLAHPQGHFQLLRLVPTPQFLKLDLQLRKSKATSQMLLDASLVVLDYESRSGRYRLHLYPQDFAHSSDIITQILKESWYVFGDA